MTRDLTFVAVGIMVGLAALFMGSSLKKNYSSDLTFAPDSPSYIAHPAATKHFFRPGTGIGVEPVMGNTANN